MKKKNNDLELKIYNLNDKVIKFEKELNKKNERLKELGDEVEEIKIEENEEKTINDINMNNQNFENENGNLIDKSLYENINNKYLKIKEDFEKYKIEKNTEIEELKINNLQSIEDEKKN